MAIVTCGKVHTDEWVNRMAPELLDIPHLHLTLTIAKEMRCFFDPGRSLLQVLLTVAAEAVRSQLIASRPQRNTDRIGTRVPRFQLSISRGKGV